MIQLIAPCSPAAGHRRGWDRSFAAAGAAGITGIGNIANIATIADIGALDDITI